jgi:4-hydroxy-tetrahydrodipicolinate reductase
MTRLVVVGAKGRMGRAVLACAAQDPEVQVVGQVDQGDDLAAVIAGCDAVVDFSVPAASPAVAECCVQAAKAAVIGTTGHRPEEKARLTLCARSIPMVWSANFSSGVNALFWLTRRAAEILGPAFDLEIVEMHHRRKRDAPSGTATTLAEVLAAVRHQQCADVVRHGRQGLLGERTATEIGMHALRGGDVVGDHTVVFAGEGERLELAHKASSRETFARGALRAAGWVVGRPAGWYTMQDVLGLK